MVSCLWGQTGYWEEECDLHQNHDQDNDDDGDDQVYPPKALAVAGACSLLGGPDGSRLRLLGNFLLHVRHGERFWVGVEAFLIST